MGLTIHYQFSLNNATLTQAREKAIALRNLALQLPFQRVDELVEIAGDACNCDRDNVDDPHAYPSFVTLGRGKVEIRDIAVFKN